MHTPRLGYACINTCLQEDPTIIKRLRPCVNRSCIAKTFREKGVEYAIELARGNLETVIKVLEWNEVNGIRLYRMSSDMFPHITNPKFISEQSAQTYAYPLDHFDDLFKKIGQYAQQYNHRLTFHPGQFNQLGAKNPKILENTIRELSVHSEILDRIGCGPESVIVVHGGGVYGDKEATIKRWAKQFKQLPKHARDRIVIENCERQYNYADMLRLSKLIGRPVVFDTHHHTCYCDLINPLPDPSTFILQIIETWTTHGLIPKFHI
jgi:UV DNA damage endonuclease